MKNTYKVLDLFAGAGGFSKGFEQAGFEIVAALEKNKHALKTFEKNHYNTYLINEDICLLPPEDLKDKIGDIDIIIGGPPCQGFSIAGKRDLSDQRNTLPLEYLKYINYFQPKMFVMENVKGILSFDDGKVFNFLIEQFNEIGYKTSFKLVQAVKHGLPQIRERVFIVGVRADIDNTFEFPLETNEISTLGDCLEDLIDVNNQLANHDIFVPANQELYSKLREGQFLCDVRHGEAHVHSWEISLKGEVSFLQKSILDAISENRRKKIYGPKDGNPLSLDSIVELLQVNLNSQEDILHIDRETVYQSLNELVDMEYLDLINSKYDIHDRKVNMGMRIFDRNLPVNTITTLSGLTCNYAHYSQPRGFTVREVARLQTFPDDFVFYGPINEQRKQVGNAVPPKLAYLMAESVKSVLRKDVLNEEIKIY